jgi:D-arabinose 1-dehydrogenase-like Zn-dependent alcohol dehydrogenase
VIVEIKASGMCGSDLPPYRAGADAFRPIVRGHEPCGVVVARGTNVAEDEAPLGQRVMIHHYSGCGQCKHCRVGYAQMCLEGNLVYGSTTHGGHADFILVRPHMLVPLTDELSFAEGAAISCGTGTAYLALRRLAVSGRETLVIFGQGRLGSAARCWPGRWAPASSPSTSHPSACSSRSSLALTSRSTRETATLLQR